MGEALETFAKSAKSRHPSMKLSLELEKTRKEDLALAVHGDVVFFSRAFCELMGYSEARPFLKAMVDEGHVSPHCVAVCAWGQHGAFARQGDREFYSPAFPPSKVVDTVGAGDTFN